MVFISGPPVTIELVMEHIRHMIFLLIRKPTTRAVAVTLLVASTAASSETAPVLCQNSALLK